MKLEDSYLLLRPAHFVLELASLLIEVFDLDSQRLVTFQELVYQLLWHMGGLLVDVGHDVLIYCSKWRCLCDGKIVIILRLFLSRRTTLVLSGVSFKSSGVSHNCLRLLQVTLAINGPNQH